MVLALEARDAGVEHDFVVLRVCGREGGSAVARWGTARRVSTEHKERSARGASTRASVSAMMDVAEGFLAPAAVGFAMADE